MHAAHMDPNQPFRAASGQAERPIMVHRAIFGSLERFFAILLESCGGDLPLWLATLTLMVAALLAGAAAEPALLPKGQAAPERGFGIELELLSPARLLA